MLPFVGTKDERTGSVIKQEKRNLLLNSVSLLSDLETDRCNNENKKNATQILHNAYYSGTI